MPSKISKILGVFLFCLLTLCAALAQTPQFAPFASAQPVLSAMRDELPPELKTSSPVTADAWNNWVRSRDKEIRGRIEGGEADTLTNLLCLGVTYTKEPRILDPQKYGKDSAINSLAEKRADDLIRALAGPHLSEGMLEMRVFLGKKGLSPATPDGRKKIKAYLLANLAHQRDDLNKWGAELSAKKISVYQLFKDRGISTDSNLYPDYTIERHLRQMMEKGLLTPGSVHRVAIVGPGLDFVNKSYGSDFYPPQTTQPFAVIDSLARLGLADPASVEVYTFDISPRVNRHIERARKTAAAGKPYTVQLLCTPLDQWESSFRAAFLEYWQKFGDRIGKPATRIAVPAAAAEIWNRAVTIRPGVVLRVTPVDMNVVYQTLPLAPDQQFDVVIGTNIFIYYGGLEQALARANLGTMIKPGGFLLTNELLPDTAPSKLANSLQTSVLTAPGDTEYVYGYVRQK